jgi:hypothetical protein
MLPHNGSGVRAREPQASHMLTAGETVGESPGQSRREILVKEKFHVAPLR